MTTLHNPRQRHHFRFDARRRQVRGNIYVDGKRAVVKLASFEQARIIGLDVNKEPIHRSKRDKTWSDNFLMECLRGERKRLLDGAKETARRGAMVKALMQDWLDASQGVRSPRTMLLYRRMANEYIAAFKDHPIGEFKRRHWDKFESNLRASGLSGATVSLRMKNLKTFLRWALEQEELTRLPPLRMPRVEKKLPRVMSPAQLHKLSLRIAVAQLVSPMATDRRAYHLHERALLMACYTGARAAEITFHRWDQFDLDISRIRIEMQRRFTIKEKKEKHLPMPADFRGYLLDLRHRNPHEVYYLDNGQGEPAYAGPAYLSRAIRRHMDALCIPKGIKPLHGLRAMFVGHLVNTLGVDLATAQQWLGHSTIAVTAGYLADPEHRLRAAATRFVPMLIWDKHATAPDRNSQVIEET